MILTIVVVYTVFVFASFFGLLSVAYPYLDNIIYSFYHIQDLFPVSIMPLVGPLLEFILDFSVSLIQTLGYVGYMLAMIAFHVSVHIGGLIIRLIPVFWKLFRTTTSFCSWLVGQLWKSFMIRDNPIWSTVSWTFMFCTCILYFERIFRRQPQTVDYTRVRNGDDVQEANMRNEVQEAIVNQERILERIIRDQNHRNNDSTSDDNDIDENTQNEQNTSQENRMTNDTHNENLCIVCLENERTIAVFPCGHMQFCAGCVQTIMRGRRLCPVCQGRINDHRRVYI